MELELAPWRIFCLATRNNQTSLGLKQKKTHNGEYWDHGKENGHYYMAYWGYIGIMEKKMETTMRHPPLQQGAARN